MTWRDYLLALAATRRAPTALLAGVDARGRPRCRVLRGACVTIGRSSGVALRLEDPTVSGIHCLLTHGAWGHWHVCDAGSENGTWLNGRRLRGAAALRHGDCISIGRTNTFLVFMPASRRNAPPGRGSHG